MGDDEPAVDWEGVIREMITRATEAAPTEPGVYKMPCGECVVDFFITAEGEERWPSIAETSLPFPLRAAYSSIVFSSSAISS